MRGTFRRVVGIFKLLEGGGFILGEGRSGLWTERNLSGAGEKVYNLGECPTRESYGASYRNSSESPKI